MRRNWSPNTIRQQETMRIFIVFFVQCNKLNIFITFFRACEHISTSVT